jgi:predicted nucleic acid-binding protein
MKRIIIDTCVWYACFDKTDSNYQYSDKILKILNLHDIIIPFPTLYETINTRFVKNNYGQMDGLFSFINNPSKVYLVDDSPYKDKAKSIVFSSLNRNKSYSLVDMIIRLMMEDISLGEIAVMTFNVGDFVGVNNTEIINPKDI